MQHITTLSALVALLLSAASLSVSILNYRRDRVKVRAWSRLIWADHAGQGGPLLRIRIINEGRRAIALVSLVRKAKHNVWWQPLLPIRLETSDAFKAQKELERLQLAPVTTVKLCEGEAFEMFFQAGDSNEFFAIHQELFIYAQTLLIEDLSANRYPVRGSRESIAEAIREWKQIEARMEKQRVADGLKSLPADRMPIVNRQH